MGWLLMLVRALGRQFLRAGIMEPSKSRGAPSGAVTSSASRSRSEKATLKSRTRLRGFPHGRYKQPTPWNWGSLLDFPHPISGVSGRAASSIQPGSTPLSAGTAVGKYLKTPYAYGESHLQPTSSLTPIVECQHQLR